MLLSQSARILRAEVSGIWLYQALSGLYDEVALPGLYDEEAVQEAKRIQESAMRDAVSSKAGHPSQCEKGDRPGESCKMRRKVAVPQ